jgi:hypothetical protein
VGKELPRELEEHRLFGPWSKRRSWRGDSASEGRLRQSGIRAELEFSLFR